MSTIFKCPLCNNFKAKSKQSVYNHIEKKHMEEFKKSKLNSVSQFYFNIKYNKDCGHCIMCGKPTEWNEQTEKYNRLCSNKCSEKYREQFKQRMMNKYGKTHLLNDPEVQKRMLANRKISGQYKWVDGTYKVYTGSYEHEFLEFLDLMMRFESKDVLAPAPQVFKYKYEGRDHFYIPDFYIASLNLLVEIKDGGDNPNTHHKILEVDKQKELIKDEMMSKQKDYNYLKVVDKDYSIFMNYLIDIKTGNTEWIPPKDNNFKLSESIDYASIDNYFNKCIQIFNESFDENILLNEDEEVKDKALYVIITAKQNPDSLNRTLSKIIGGGPFNYSHCLISLYPDLREIYSFELSGFTVRNKKQFKKDYYRCKILKVDVTSRQHRKVKEFIKFFKENNTMFAYNFEKIINIVFNKKTKLTDKYVCSQFVSKCCAVAGVNLDKDYSLYDPMTFTRDSNFKEIVSDELVLSLKI